jgi:nifR3 family TIM-barrel protein
MAGITDWPFRLLCVEQGAGLVYTEMVNARALHHQDPETLRIAQTHERERPCAVQVFGHEPDMMAEAVSYFLTREDIALIDINMGCPTPKIVKNGDGSALMTTPVLAEQMITAAVKASQGKKPVTVKFRKGWTADNQSFLEFGRMAEATGAAAVTLHGRTREQFYSGEADWESIRQLKAAVRIPVIGNGDVRSLDDADRMMRETGCDAVMIGRAAQGNPWVFQRDGAWRKSGAHRALPELRETMLRHHRLLAQYKGDTTALLEMRKHIAWYLHGIPGAAALRAEVYAAGDFETVETILARLD